MENIYLILANDYVSIKEIIGGILKDRSLSDECLIRYDLNETSLDEVINDLDTYNFLVSHKVIVCDNCFFLSGNRVRDGIEQKTDSLVKYLNNPSSENILILIAEKLDERKSIVKLLRDRAKIIEKTLTIDTLIKNALEDFKMADDVIAYLIDYCAHDNEKILNELEKLKCYKMDEREILKSDIDEIVIKNFNDNVFSLVDAIMRRDKEKAIALYEELIANGEDANKILSILADQFRMIYNGKILLREYHNNYREVASVLNVHPYRFQKAMDSSYSYSNKAIIKCLNALDDMEIKLKTGKNTIASFEMFICNI